MHSGHTTEDTERGRTMKNCGNCGGCKGCDGSLVLTEPELYILKTLGQIPFLPVARKVGDEIPVYLEDDAYETQVYSLALQCLEKKMLIELDYHMPLKQFDYSAYSAYQLHGSMALTQRGQQILELAELEGISAE